MTKVKAPSGRFNWRAALLPLGLILSSILLAEEQVSPDPNFRVVGQIAADDFRSGWENWRSEAEEGSTIRTVEGKLEVDVPGGCTLWWRRELGGPILIEYEVEMVRQGGPNDRVSDLNCFWMAQDARSPGDLFATARSGKFADYDQLKCYYVGYGGNTNSTTRFRRYIGEKGNRPLLPEHDLSAREYLLLPNRWQKIQLLAAGPEIAYYHDGRLIFHYTDPQPYTQGWFALRTVTSHVYVRNFRIYRLAAAVSH